METKVFTPGDKVILNTKHRSWTGHILQSHDPEIVLLKLESGYNIGIRENEILDAKIIEKSAKKVQEQQKHEPKENLPNIAMIVAGGTISSRLDSKTGGVISTDVSEILKIAPEIKEICNIKTISSPFLKFSENNSYEDWKKIAIESEKFLNDSSIDGVIITHGTDTLHYTGAALSFFIKNLNKPIALTFSQRSIDRGSTDAALNLICAARYATSDIAEISIVGHKNSSDEICIAMPATKTRKMHTSSRDAFKIINSSPLAEITRDEIIILQDFQAKNKNQKVELDTKYEEDVALIKVYPGQDPKIIDYYIEKDYKGLVLEVTGLGHVPGDDSKKNWFPTIKKAINEGMIICASAQTLYGSLNPNVYSAGRKLQETGIIFLDDMLPETAMIKLSWVLGHKDWKKNIKEKMLENISREISER